MLFSFCFRPASGACVYTYLYVDAEKSILRCGESESQRKMIDDSLMRGALCVQIEENKSFGRGRLSTSRRIKSRSPQSTVFCWTPAFNLQVRVLVYAGLFVFMPGGSGGVGTEEVSENSGMHSTFTQCDLMCLLTYEPPNTTYNCSGESRYAAEGAQGIACQVESAPILDAWLREGNSLNNLLHQVL